MILFIIAFAIWAVLHSLTASSSLKQWWRAQFGERAYQGWYRFFYNVVSVLSFLPILYVLATQVPQDVLWIIPAPWRWLTLLVQLAALMGLLYALLQTDVWSFVGLRQIARYFSGDPSPEAEEQLVVSGPYRWVRHPLYFFSLLVIWLTPMMTLGTFIFNVLATLYFWIGSIYEERRLTRIFGSRYASYQAEVPRLIPWRLSAYKR